MTLKDHRRPSDRRALPVQRAWNGPRPGLAFLVATVFLGCLDFAADEVVAFGSCQCRLMIFVSTGGTIVGDGANGMNGSVGCNAGWAWGFMTCIGYLEPISLGQCLSEAK